MKISINTLFAIIIVIALITAGLIEFYPSKPKPDSQPELPGSTSSDAPLPDSMTGVLYEEPCQSSVSKTRICKITITNKTASHAVAKVHYHYVKGSEDKNRLFIIANKGRFDNTIGVREAYGLVEGDNYVDVIFGLFNPDKFSRKQAYLSDFFSLEVRGVDEQANIYIRPSIINITTKYHQAWYSQEK